jgi:hypothetical protein
MALRRFVGPAVVALVVSMPLPTHAMGSMESQVFGLINGERSTALIEHSGLLAVARAHSAEMAASGGLNHDNADWRISNAPADPPQAGGGPDAGFAQAAWCENVTYSNGFPESQVAGKLFEQWRRSAPHQACMTNSGKNVAAVGIYYDGSTWWATFIAEVDHTPPGGSAQPQAPPAAAPAATGQPSRTTPVATGQPAAGTAPAAAAGNVQSVPESSVTTPSANTNAPANFSQRIEPIADRAPIPESSVRRHEIAANPVPRLTTLLRTTSAELPDTERIEFAGLAMIALMAFRRFEKRPRIKTRRRRASGSGYPKSRPDATSLPLRGRYAPPSPVRELVSA